jgi:hypothetical protein
MPATSRASLNFFVAEPVAVAAQLQNRALPDRDDDLLVRQPSAAEVTGVHHVHRDSGLFDSASGRAAPGRSRERRHRRVDALQGFLLVRSFDQT